MNKEYIVYRTTDDTLHGVLNWVELNALLTDWGAHSTLIADVQKRLTVGGEIHACAFRVFRVKPVPRSDGTTQHTGTATADHTYPKTDLARAVDKAAPGSEQTGFTVRHTPGVKAQAEQIAKNLTELGMQGETGQKLDARQHKKASEQQVGGDHYTRMKIQPLHFCAANELGPHVSKVIKYVCRYKSKNGHEDLHKAIHTLQHLIEFEEEQERERLAVQLGLFKAEEQEHSAPEFHHVLEFECLDSSIPAADTRMFSYTSDPGKVTRVDTGTYVGRVVERLANRRVLVAVEPAWLAAREEP